MCVLASQMIREEVEVHERNVMETDHTGMITLVFMTAAGANEAARERFLSLCSDWGKEFNEKDDEEEEEEEEAKAEDESWLEDQGVEISSKSSNGTSPPQPLLRTYSYTFGEDDVAEEGERVVDRTVSFEVVAVPTR